jgi:hypothetical protein
MASQRKTYILAPNWEFHPDGPIALGSIITDPKNPARSLNKTNRVPIEPHLITTSPKENWSIRREDLLACNGGIWASFLAPLLGVGADVSTNVARHSDETYKCERLDTVYFQPDEEYLILSLKNPVVQGYIKKTWFEKSVYMVTGVKIAHGASVETGAGSGFGGEVGITFGAEPVAAVPVHGGPSVTLEKSSKETTSFTGSQPFVLGYQLIKITSKKGGPVDKDYNKLALLDDADDAGDRKLEIGSDWDITDVQAPSVDLEDMLKGSATDDDCDIIYRSV